MKYSIEYVQKIAKERNGVVLSTSYKNTSSKLIFKCNVCDTQWEACLGSIIYHNTWCPYCSKKTRKTTKEVKSAIEKVGYKLLSEYKNNCTKLKMECSEGHEYKATWAKFQSGRRCPYCAGNKKKTINEVGEELAKDGYELICESKYKHTHQSVEIKCPKGHIYKTKLVIFTQGHRCPYCAGNKKKTTSEIKKILAKYGYELLSKYVNSEIPMTIKCPKGHIYQDPYDYFRSGRRCLECAGKNQTTEKVKKYFKKEGYELLSEYKNSCIKMKIKCSEGHVYYANWSKFNQGQRCPECNGGIKLEEDYVRKEIEKSGYQLLSKYKNAYTKIKLKCPKGHIYKAAWANFQQGQRCPYCQNKSESKFREAIEKILCAKFPKVKPKWLLNENGNRLELDGYNEELRVAFEYQGGQHFDENHYFNKKADFNKIKKHDNIKKKLCKEKNIILLCPTYELDEEDYNYFIYKTMKEYEK